MTSFALYKLSVKSALNAIVVSLGYVLNRILNLYRLITKFIELVE